MRIVENKHWLIRWDEETDMVTIASKNHLIGNEYSVLRVYTPEAHDLKDMLDNLLRMPERNI